jgi:hypothetical protein
MICWHWPSLWLWDLLPDLLMGSGSVEVLDICFEYTMELLLMEDEQVIKTFTSHTSEEPLTDGIRSRDVIGCCEDLDATRVRNTGEVHPKLAIVIPDEVLRPRSIGGGFPKRYVLPRHRWAIVEDCGRPHGSLCENAVQS